MTARQACPQLKKRPTLAALTAESTSASSRTIMGSDPPSSSVTRFTPRAASSATCFPTGVDPVNATFATRRSVTRASPRTDPLPVTTWKTSSGSPCSRMISAIRRVVSGVVSAGFATTTLPQTSAGPSLLPSSVVGKFQGTIATTTPSGRLRTSPWVRTSRLGTYPPRRFLARPA